MNADFLARWYRWVEYIAFGRALEKSRTTFLNRLQNRKRILILGEGDGRTLQQLLQIIPSAEIPAAEIEVVESSRNMIALAQKRIQEGSHVQFRNIDARTITWPANTYDAIITHFFFDCFSEQEIRILMDNLTQSLQPEGLWLLTDFSIPQKGWRNWHARIWVSIMYRFFNWTTGLAVRNLPPSENLMEDAGLHRIDRKITRAGLISASIWQKTEIH